MSWTKKQLRELSREVMGKGKAEMWWKTGNMVFEGRFPEDMLDSDLGRLELLQELNAMHRGELPDTCMGS